MKRIKNILVKSLSIACLTLTLAGCDLALQEEFDFKPSVDPYPTFENMTAWDWIQTRKTSDELVEQGMIDGNEFELLKQAIEVAGMQDVFSQPGKDKTFLLLNNNAFTGAGDIIQLVTGSATGDLANANVEVLTKILQYHIVTTYITQNDPLKVYGFDYKFQSMLLGPDGEIYLRRNERLAMAVNLSTALPETAADEVVFRHNYVFGNGIGHIIQDYCRKVPF